MSVSDSNFLRPRLPRSAGVLLLGTGGRIQPHKVESMETACLIEEDKLIYPFAFRVHTHELGKYISSRVSFISLNIRKQFLR